MSTDDPRVTGEGCFSSMLCRGCGSYHPPSTPCLGSIVFGPPDTNPAPAQVPTFDLRPPEARIEAKLDRIIELLERLVSREDERNE